MKKFIVCAFGILFALQSHAATLPAGYTELEYVTFDGTSSTGAYVDTGLKYYTDVPNNKVRLVADAKVYQGSGWQVVVGSIGSVSAYVGTNSSNYFYYGIGFEDTNTNVMNPYQRSEFDLNAVAGTYVIKNKVTGTTMVNISNIQPIAKTTDYPILVGGFRNASGMRPERTHMDLYSVKVYNNGNLVFDGIPCKSPDNKIGIYDTVSNSFKTTPSGINTLTAGPATCRNLFDYNARTIDYYLESDGSLKSQPGDAVSDFIPVEPNTTYHLSATGSRRGKFFDSNKQPIDPSVFDFTTSNGPTSFTTGATTRYVRFGMSGTIYDRTKIQLEQGSTATDYVPYCTVSDGIKIATTKYTEDAFAGLITTLESAITKVTNIVDTTVQQATEIGNLATTKQDRPDTDCPAGRKCLLIMGADNKPHWYLIQE